MLLSIAETARQLSVSTRTVRRLIETSELPSVRVRGRVLLLKQHVEDWIALRLLQEENDRARARTEIMPCANIEKIETASTSNRGRRSGTRVLPMRQGSAADEVRERIAEKKRRSF
jgi:excisionase family DNA binding protein